MDMIARDADVAKGTVYLYYPSKKSIDSDAALNGGLAALDERTAARIDAAATFLATSSRRSSWRAPIPPRAARFLPRMYIAAIAQQVMDVKARPSEFAALVDRQTRHLEAAVTRAIARREIRRVDPRRDRAGDFRSHARLVRAPPRIGRRRGLRRRQRLSRGPDLRGRWRRTTAGARPTGARQRAKANAGQEQRHGQENEQDIHSRPDAGGGTRRRAPAGAQAPRSPFMGSAGQGVATAEPLALSVKEEAVTLALKHNLGLLLQEQAVKTAHGAKWRALADLLPDVSANVGEARQVINLDAYGFPGEPSIIGPFNVFDARVGLSQPVLDMRALNDSRAASASERAEALGVRTARDLRLARSGQPVSRGDRGRQPHRGRARATGDRGSALPSGLGPQDRRRRRGHRRPSRAGANPE